MNKLNNDNFWAKDDRSKMINCWNFDKLTAVQNFLQIIKLNNEKKKINKDNWIIPMLEGKVGKYLIPCERPRVKQAFKKNIKLKGAF